MWVNVGSSQFHLPSRHPTQRHRGLIGLVLPGVTSNREKLLLRLRRGSSVLQNTSFSFDDSNDHVDVTCPWGNRLRLHPAEHRLMGCCTLGLAYVEFDVPVGSLSGIGRFYREVIGAAVGDSYCQSASGSCARILCGAHQALIFRESSSPLPEYDGYHIMLTLSDFPCVFSRLCVLRLITRGHVSVGEYRFTDIVDVDTGSVLFQVEHECRSTQHALYQRPLLNCGAAAADS
jgi:hypothetical protein